MARHRLESPAGMHGIRNGLIDLRGKVVMPRLITRKLASSIVVNQHVL